MGQTESHAIVVEKFEDVKQLKETGQLDFSKDIYLYSQTTKSLDEFHRIIEYCQEHIVEGAVFKSLIPSAVRWLTACLTSLPLPASMMSSSL